MLITVKHICHEQIVFTLIEAGLPAWEYSVILDSSNRLIVVDNETNTFIGQVITKNNIILKHPPWRVFLPKRNENAL